MEVNPDPEQTPDTSTAPSPLMAGLAVLITEAPEHLRIFISKWDEKNDAAKNKKLIDKATTENYAREVLAYLWNTDVENNAVKALTKKDDVLFQLVIALENLLQEQCKKCEGGYRVKRTDTPAVRCALCKQGYHEECLTMELKTVITNLNCGVVGRFNWLCPECD